MFRPSVKVLAGATLVLAFLAGPGGAFADSYHYASLEEALAVAGKEHKPLLLDFGTSW
jgi:hypothetical protein